jgi:hypothetical protein
LLTNSNGTEAQSSARGISARASVVQALGGVVVGAAAIAGALMWSEARIGSLPALISPAGLLICLAAGAFSFALLVPWRLANARREEAVARLPGVEVSMGAVTTAGLKQDLSKVAGIPVRGWPPRVTVAGSNTGLEFWADTGSRSRVSIPWTDVVGLGSGRILALGRVFPAVLVDLADDHSIGIPLAPVGRLGVASVSTEELDAFVMRLSELRSRSRLP